MSNSVPLGVGLYGSNGHQIHKRLESHPEARLVAFAEMPREALPDSLRDSTAVREYPSLEALLEDPKVDLVSICSPRRVDQAKHSIAALRAGKHVYAEKPCALTEDDLDAIAKAATEHKRIFHEMGGSLTEEPYRTMGQIVAAGTIGTVVQVFAQKSYPWHPKRPSDENIDGGLIMQVGIHAVRMVEQAAGTRIAAVQAGQTMLGDPAGRRGLHMASAMLLELENGGIASIIANYLNPRGVGHWGNEELRIFGTEGMIEATDSGTRTRLVVGTEDRGPLKPAESRSDYFDSLIGEIRRHEPTPRSLEEEIHATRIVIRASEAARQGAGKRKII